MTQCSTIPTRSAAASQLEWELYTLKIDYESEYRFDKSRRWRFDIAMPGSKLAIEVDGLTDAGGRHQRREGYEADLQKFDAAMRAGWQIYRCSASMVFSGQSIDTVQMLLESRRSVKPSHVVTYRNIETRA